MRLTIRTVFMGALYSRGNLRGRKCGLDLMSLLYKCFVPIPKNLVERQASPKCRIFSFPSLNQLSKCLHDCNSPYPRRHPPIKPAVHSIAAPILLFVQQFLNSFWTVYRTYTWKVSVPPMIQLPLQNKLYTTQWPWDRSYEPRISQQRWRRPYRCFLQYGDVSLEFFFYGVSFFSIFPWQNLYVRLCTPSQTVGPYQSSPGLTPVLLAL